MAGNTSPRQMDRTDGTENEPELLQMKENHFCDCIEGQKLWEMTAFSQKMAQAAKEYLEILVMVSSNVIKLRQELHGPFQTIPKKILPQGITNSTEDPTEMIQQLGDFCHELSKQVKTLEADNSTLSQDWEANVNDLETEKEALFAKLKNSEERIVVLEDELTDSVEKLLRTEEELQNKTDELEQKTLKVQENDTKLQKLVQQVTDKTILLAAKEREEKKLMQNLDEAKDAIIRLQQELRTKPLESKEMSSNNQEIVIKKTREESVNAASLLSQTSRQQSEELQGECNKMQQGLRTKIDEAETKAKHELFVQINEFNGVASVEDVELVEFKAQDHTLKQDQEADACETEKLIGEKAEPLAKVEENEENKNKADQQLVRKQEECNQLRQELETKCNEIQRLNHAKEDLNAKLIDLEKTCSAKTKDEQQLMQKLKEAQNTVSNLNKNQKAKVTAVEKMTVAKDDLLNRLNDCEEKLSAKTREVEALRQQVNESRNENSCLRKELVIKGDEIAQLTGEKVEVRNTSEKMLAAKIKEEKKSQQQLEESANEISRLKEDQKSAIKKLASEKQELQTQVQQLAESQTERERLKYEKEELENENEKLLNKVKNCEERIATQNVEEQKLVNQVKELQAKNNKYSDNYGIKSGELETVTNEKKELHRRLKDCELAIENIRQWTLHHAELSCLMPLSAHEDSRITPVITEFMQILNSRCSGHDIDIIPKAGSEINNTVLPVILPCIAASRVGSDISAALTKAKIESGQVILLIFHHLAPHNCKITTPTEKRLSDRTLLDQCVGMVDAVFWNGAMYDCAANRAAVERVQDLLQWSIDLHHLLELKQLV